MKSERSLRAVRGTVSRALNPNDLFALKYIHEAKLSPDGLRIAYVTSRTVEESGEEFFEIAIEELTSGSRRELRFPGRAMAPRWSPDSTCLAFIGTAGGGSSLYVSDASANAFNVLTPKDVQVEGAFGWSPDGSQIAYTAVSREMYEGIRRITTRDFRSEGQGFVQRLSMEIHLLNVSSGATRALNLGKVVSMRPEFSPCGKRLLFMGSDSPVAYSVSFLKGAKLLIVDLETGHANEILGDPWLFAGATWSPCGKRIVFAGAYDSPLPVPTLGLWVVNCDGSAPQCRTQRITGNVGFRIHHDMPTWGTALNHGFSVPDAGHAYATVTVHGCAEIWRIGLEGRQQCESVVRGQRSALLLDVNARTSQLLFAVSDLNLPWELHRSDFSGGGERRITRLNSHVLDAWPAMAISHLRFESPDGLPLEGWFLTRADRQGPQPTVMFIHGGPYHATGHAFRFDFHLLAANGYSVLFANFRGSTGYGEPFARAIMGDWGARAFPDHMAAVDAAVERGFADGKRLGVWGHSHGGFATAWIVGHTSRFRAAVVEAGVTNFTTMYYLSDAPHLLTCDLGGRPDEVPDVYRSRSPLTYAWRCRTPTLLLHGEDDLRCPMVEAEQFYRALHDVGCVTELVQIPGMNHMGDSTGPLPARRGQNEALLDWFERHL